MSHSQFGIPLLVNFSGRAWEWRLRGDRLLDGQAESNTSTLHADLPTEPGGDAWVLRESFLAVKSRHQLLEFLGRNGQFCSKVGANFWSVRSMLGWQPLLRWMMKRPPSKWQGTGVDAVADCQKRELLLRYRSLTVRFWTKGGASIWANDILGAMLATVYVDALTGPKKFGFCARPDCCKLFQRQSSHKRLYCSYECAHLEAVRRARKRAKGQVKVPPRARG